MPASFLPNLIQDAQSQNLHINHLIVRQNNQIIARHDFIPEVPTLLYSVSKTFTSIAIGLALHDNLLKLSDPITQYFPSLATQYPNPRLEQITIHHLLSMSTGHDKCPIFTVSWDNNEQWDIAELFFRTPTPHEPSSTFTYNNAATYLLSRIISLVTNQPLDQYLDAKIFQHINIPTPHWDTCPLGTPQGFSGLHLTATQLSLFSQLLLDQGKHNSKQLIPAEYIALATQPHTSTAAYNNDFTTPDHQQGYGYQLWINSYPNSYRLDGLNGQFAVILPQHNATVTYISNEPNQMMRILELTWNHITPNL